MGRGLVLNALGRGQQLTPAYFHLNFRFSFCKIRVIRNSWESAEDVRGISDAGARTNHRRLFFVGSRSGVRRNREGRVAGSSQGRRHMPPFQPIRNLVPVLDWCWCHFTGGLTSHGQSWLESHLMMSLHRHLLQ